MAQCSKIDAGEDDAECCATLDDDCEHTSVCHWRVTDYGDDYEVRWCDTHEREFDLFTG